MGESFFSFPLYPRDGNPPHFYFIIMPMLPDDFMTTEKTDETGMLQCLWKQVQEKPEAVGQTTDRWVLIR